MFEENKYKKVLRKQSCMQMRAKADVHSLALANLCLTFKTLKP